MKSKIGLLGLCAILSSPVALTQVLDQECAVSTNQISYGITYDYAKAQTFTVGISGELVAFDLYLTASSSIYSVYWDIRPTSGGAPEATNANALASGSVVTSSLPNSWGFYTFNLSSGATVHAGDVLAITMSTTASSTVASFGGRSDNPYGGGSLYTDGAMGTATTWSAVPAYDLGFRTYVVPASVPEPETVSLLFGLVTLLAVATGRRYARN